MVCNWWEFVMYNHLACIWLFSFDMLTLHGKLASEQENSVNFTSNQTFSTKWFLTTKMEKKAKLFGCQHHCQNYQSYSCEHQTPKMETKGTPIVSKALNQYILSLNLKLDCKGIYFIRLCGVPVWF